MRLRLVADDLTGALDSAAQFCGSLGPIPVLLATEHVGTRHAALDIASRDLGPDEAVALAGRSRDFLEGGAPAFKKVDSLLRGHWASELAATMSARFRSCVLAPAFPAQGRVTRHARQYARQTSGDWQAVGPDLLKEIKEAGLGCRSGIGSDGEWEGVHVCDAETEDDLAAIVAAAQSLPQPLLWCGSAGLAGALAGGVAAPHERSTGTVLAIIGSHHPVSTGQVAAVETLQPGIPRCRLGAHRGETNSVASALAGAGRALVTFDIEPGITTSLASQTIERCLAELVQDLAAPGTLVAAGGETLRAICRAVSAERLLVHGEFCAGVPVATLVGGRWHGTRVLSKSGAFGGPDLLSSMIGEPQEREGRSD